MKINLYFVIPALLVVVCLVAWLVYSNSKDEKKFEDDLDEEEELETERERKK